MALRKQGRSKKKGKRPTKREIVQMNALKQLGKSAYSIGLSLGRSHHTIQKYINAPFLTDPKYAAMVEDYKQKEILDLTTLNIKSRARLHDLVETMTPLEATALMDRAFQQRRLLEGKSTENVFSLRRIIADAHEEPAKKDPKATPGIPPPPGER